MTGGHFSDPEAVARYAEGPRQKVPAFDDVHRMVDQLLGESMPSDGRVLVIGAGGGLELKYLAERHAGWRFDGVDPSAEMLQLANDTLGPLAPRATLQQGYTADAPPGPFDAATCLLVLHFLPAEERLATLQEIRARLRPGAPLLTVHHSVPTGDARVAWFERSVRWGAGPDGTPEAAGQSARAMAERLPLVTPDQDEALLREAGFENVGLYYAALSFRGWIAYA